MKSIQSQAIVQEIMEEFAIRNGFIDERANPKRYLWTDAFAVCNFLGLYQESGDIHYKDLALKLVDQVHHVLGQYRKDDVRKGWISGLDEEEGKKHPTIGGLRIGKPLNERKPEDPYNEQLEWDRDGQYFHYLTKWMHALSRVTQVTGDHQYNRWAIELAKTAHAKFTYRLQGHMEKRMYWKMSIDLSYPLVSSMGQHDALDALVIYMELTDTATGDPERSEGADLAAETSDALDMCHHMHWMTDDPLGIGGLLSDACILTQLIAHNNPIEEEILLKLLHTAQNGLDSFLNTNMLRYPATHRLAFRELGLAIGLKAISEMLHFFPDEPLLKKLKPYQSLADEIIHFWLLEENQQNTAWREHVDINSIMLATALAPQGYQELYIVENDEK